MAKKDAGAGGATTLRLSGDPSVRARHAYTLTAYFRDGATSVPLPVGKPTIVGRRAPSDLVIEDRSLSRRHALFLVEDGAISVSDLGSTNGIVVRGESTESALIKPGEPVKLGGVICAVHQGHRAAGLGLASHEVFEARLREALAAARHFGDEGTVVMLRLVRDGEAAHLGTWLERVRPLLEAVDHAAAYTESTLELWLPRCGLEAAKRRVDALRERVAAEGGLATAGLAVHPRAGAGGDELVAAARRALDAARRDDPMPVAPDAAKRVVAVAKDDDPVVESASMKAIYTQLERMARAQLPVLLLGETGTGKEVVAREIHQRSSRSGGPLVCVNCGAIPSQLVESTLFGHERGAFTGADKRAKGVFEAADGGTVFLDELGELPMAVQVSLLRTLETGKIVRVGSTEELSVDFRIVAATNRDLEAMCEQERFREDLLYRINALTLVLPPLRERRADIAPLAQRFLRGAVDMAGGVEVEGFDEEALAALEAHDWPGNIRQLRNAVERACVITDGPRISIDDLPPRIRPSGRPSSSARPSSTPAPDDIPPSEEGVIDLREQVKAYEIGLIRKALRDSGGNQSAAARQLSLPVRTLMYKVKSLGLDPSGD